MPLTTLLRSTTGTTFTNGFVHAYSSDPFESHFRPFGSSSTLHLHAAPPFLAPVEDPAAARLQIWRDPACDVHISLRIDWSTSIGKLVLRYRAIVAAWPLAIGLLCLRRQLRRPATEVSVTFSVALDLVVRNDLPWLSGALLAIELLQTLAACLGVTSQLRLHTVVLGNDLAIFWPLSPVFLYLTAGLSYLLHYVVWACFYASASAWSVTSRYTPLLATPRCASAC